MALPSLPIPLPPITGMQPQGSEADNPDWIVRATKFLNNVKDCGDLQDAINRFFNHQQAKIHGLNQALVVAKIIYDFVQNPVSAITELVKVLVKIYFPQASAYPTLIKKAINVATEVGQLVSAAGNAFSRLINCNGVIPSVTGLISADTPIPAAPTMPAMATSSSGSSGSSS